MVLLNKNKANESLWEEIAKEPGQQELDEDKRGPRFLPWHEKKISQHFGNILRELQIRYPSDPQTKETPKRFARMMMEVCGGRFEPPPNITVFKNTNVDELITVGPISVRSLCSHHFVPFIGHAYIGYIPKDKIIGLSKFSRIVDWYARRPQIQEELTTQIYDYILEKLDPLALGVVINAIHFCMIWRGVKDSAQMSTQKLGGYFKDNATARAEFSLDLECQTIRWNAMSNFIGAILSKGRIVVPKGLIWDAQHQQYILEEKMAEGYPSCRDCKYSEFATTDRSKLPVDSWQNARCHHVEAKTRRSSYDLGNVVSTTYYTSCKIMRELNCECGCEARYF